jgi:eukaryotic-like serine/threonine-protein kinase
VMLERGTGRALVTDFGIARAADSVDTPRSGLSGTPQYMSPEQARGDDVDGRSDLYSLGVTAFFATTGRLPFEGTSVAGLLSQHAGSPAPPVRSLAPRVPVALAAAVDRCLEKDAASRFPSAEALAGALEAARGMQADVPAPIRAFLKEADAASGEIATSLTAAGMSLTVFLTTFGPSDIAGIIFVPATLLLASMGGVRLAQTMAAARDLARQGYGYDAVRPAAALEERAQAIAAVMSAEQAAHARREAALLATVGAVKTAVFVWLVSLDGPTWLNLIGLAGAIGVPTAAIRHIWNVLRPGKPVWPKLLRSRFGRWLFRVAGLGIREPALPAPVAGEPTAIALGRATEEVFAALSATQRQRLEAVPGLIERLQGDVLALRARGESTAGNGRLQTAMVALETLRLDLLRLAAGTGTMDELTQNLEAARRIGEEIDAELDSRREVRDLLR